MKEKLGEEINYMTKTQINAWEYVFNQLKHLKVKIEMIEAKLEVDH